MKTAVVERSGGTDTPGKETPAPAPAGKPVINTALLALLGAGGWLASVLAGGWAECGPVVHRFALAGHILALVLSFGAIIVVDWVGLLWLLGRRDIHDTSRVESAAQPLIWCGLAALLVTGSLIDPDLGNPLTQIKLACVLLLMLNGILLAPTMRKLHALPPGTLFSAMAAPLRKHLMIALCVSQGCWWTCVLVGLLNSTLRRWAGG